MTATPRHLRQTSAPFAWRDAGYYPGEAPPFEAPPGFVWADGLPAEGPPRWEAPSSPSRLKARYRALPLQQRVRLARVMAEVQALLSLDDAEGAQHVLSNSTLAADLDSPRQQLLTAFDASTP